MNSCRSYLNMYVCEQIIIYGRRHHDVNALHGSEHLISFSSLFCFAYLYMDITVAGAILFVLLHNTRNACVTVPEDDVLMDQCWKYRTRLYVHRLHETKTCRLIAPDEMVAQILTDIAAELGTPCCDSFP